MTRSYQKSQHFRAADKESIRRIHVENVPTKHVRFYEHDVKLLFS